MTQPPILSTPDIRARLNADQCGMTMARQLVAHLAALVATTQPPTTAALYNLREGRIDGFFCAAEALGIAREFKQCFTEAEQEGQL